MAFALGAGIEVSMNGTTWYKLTDHNRQEIEISPLLIEKESRMANGTLRKFVVSKKDVISVSWEFLPTKPAITNTNPLTTKDPIFPIVDGNYSGSWITSFYNANVGNPIYIKLVASKHTDPASGSVPADNTFVSALTGAQTYQVFITNFSRTIRKRTKVTDYVDINIEFTEI